MSSKQKRAIIFILTIAACAVMLVLFFYRLESENPVEDIQIYCGENKGISILPFRTAAEEPEQGTICFFLPFPSRIGDYHITFPENERVYIDNDELVADAALPEYDQGSAHKLTIVRKGETTAQDVQFYYADNVPVISIDMEKAAFEKVSSDPAHLEKRSSVVSIVDPYVGTSLHEYCYLGGHGGSTWDCDKKAYEFNLLRPLSLLGMKTAEKWTLISNGMDYSNLKNRVVYEAASRVGMEYSTDCEYVNLYINGNYQGLYLLTGRISSNGGVVEFNNDLDLENRMLNPDVITESSHPDPVIENEGTLDEEKYYELKYEPADVTGDYLLEFVLWGIPQAYNPDSTWFLTDSMMVKVKSPKLASKGELKYIEDYVRTAENAVFGGSYEDVIDTGSWSMVYLFMDFFGYQDDSAGSLYFYKKRNDPLIYCGPIWDYDKSMTDNFYDEEPFPYYGRAFFDVTYGENDKYQLWHARLNEYEEFHEQVVDNYREKLASVMDRILNEELPEWRKMTASSVQMDEVRWNRGEGYEAGRGEEVNEWLKKRKELFDQVYIQGISSPYADNIY